MRFTYEQRLGIRNTNGIPVSKDAAERAGKPELEGHVFDWFTRDGGVPIIVPDQWANGCNYLDGEVMPLPDDVEGTEWR